MSKRKAGRTLLIAMGLSAALVASPVAFAEKPSWAGGGKHGNKHDNKNEERDGNDDRRGGDGVSVSVGGVSVRFGDSERRTVSEYYRTQARSGHCPPGLAKKNNGCLPPGQAKKWAIGRPVGNLDMHDLPYDLRRRLPAPPAGHRYVQVAADVLLIAVGTGMVVDAMEDLLQ